MPCLSAFGVSAGSRRSTLMDLGPEKVTSTCPENFAELDPDGLLQSSRLLGAGKRFKGGAEACRLSLTWPPGSAPSANIAARVHSESERLSRDVPDDQDVCDGHTIGAVGSQ